MMLTPSGRFETNKKICLSISSFHPKNWFVRSAPRQTPRQPCPLDLTRYDIESM
jgi:hypothetical protein